jgi:hypothetical protein
MPMPKNGFTAHSELSSGTGRREGHEVATIGVSDIWKMFAWLHGSVKSDLYASH